MSAMAVLPACYIASFISDDKVIKNACKNDKQLIDDEIDYSEDYDQ